MEAKEKMEMHIQDIFERGKRKSLEVVSFHSVLHSNCTFYPKRSSTLQVTTISTLLCAAISGVGCRKERLNSSKGMGAKMLTGKGGIPERPRDQWHIASLYKAHCTHYHSLLKENRTEFNLMGTQLDSFFAIKS